MPCRVVGFLCKTVSTTRQGLTPLLTVSPGPSTARDSLSISLCHVPAVHLKVKAASGSPVIGCTLMLPLLLLTGLDSEPCCSKTWTRKEAQGGPDAGAKAQPTWMQAAIPVSGNSNLLGLSCSAGPLPEDSRQICKSIPSLCDFSLELTTLESTWYPD